MQLPLPALATLALASSVAAKVYPNQIVDQEAGTHSSIACSISDDGKTVASTRGNLGFVWREGERFTLLPTLPADMHGSA